MVGALFGVVAVALFTVGPQATLQMTIEDPVGNCVFVVIFSWIVFLVFWLWKAVRRLVVAEVYASAVLRVGSGFAFINSFLPGIILMKRLGILNWERFSVLYHYSVYVAFGIACLATVVEIEQYLARRIRKSVTGPV